MTARASLVLIHGWGRNAERMLPYVEMLHPCGFDLLVIEARNHGLSDQDGTSSMKMFSEDVRAGARFVAGRGRIASRCGVVGLSIGGSAAIHAASCEERITAVVAVGSFADPRDAMVTVGRWAWLLKPALPLSFRVVEWRIGARLADLAPERRLARSKTRVLLIHGEADSVVPVDHARRLAAAGRERAQLWVIPGRGHSDPHLEPGFAGRVTTFLAEALASSPAGSSSGETEGVP
jgi:pimeloyl-ACP methyl ester carboxylesterase